MSWSPRRSASVPGAETWIGSNLIVLLARSWRIYSTAPGDSYQDILVEVRGTLFKVMKFLVQRQLVESELKLTIAIDALEILDGEVPDPELHSQLVQSKAQKLQADRMTVLPALAAKGRYWDLLKYYLSELDIWHPAACEPTDAVVPKTASALLAELTSGSPVAPPALVVVEEGYAISVAFVQWATLLRAFLTRRIRQSSKPRRRSTSSVSAR